MVTGSVSHARQPIVRILLLEVSGTPHEVDAVIDTRFNGSLTLPAATISLLGFSFRGRTSVSFADGRRDRCDIYAETVVWDGESRPVIVEAAETDALVGMRLMAGYKITIENVDGGAVVLAPLERKTP